MLFRAVSTTQKTPVCPPSRGGDVAVNVFDINQPSLPTPFYCVLVSVSAFMALSTVFHNINSPGNSPLSHSVIPVYFCLIGHFNCICVYESLPKWSQIPGSFAMRCDPCRARKGSWRVRNPLAVVCWVQHISVAVTSLRRVVGLVRPNQSAGHAGP